MTLLIVLLCFYFWVSVSEKTVVSTCLLGEVAKGLAMGIVTMKKGEIALFTVPSDMGYGSAGRDGVPANSIVRFEVELISWITVVDVTKDGGIIKRILEQGNSDRQPSELDEVLGIFFFGRFFFPTFQDLCDCPELNVLIGTGPF